MQAPFRLPYPGPVSGALVADGLLRRAIAAPVDLEPDPEAAAPAVAPEQLHAPVLVDVAAEGHGDVQEVRSFRLRRHLERSPAGGIRAGAALGLKIRIN